jgi:hypothetical protein
MKRLLVAADDALGSAAEARNRTSEVDDKFRGMIDLLSGFEDCLSEHPTLGPNIAGTVTREADISDRSESPSAILSALKKNLHANVRFRSVS